MLNLPEKRSIGFGIFKISHRQVFLRRPVSGIGQLKCNRGSLAYGRLGLSESKLREGIRPEIHFLLPSVTGIGKAHLIVRA